MLLGCGRQPALSHIDETLLHAADTQLQFARALWVWGERDEAWRAIQGLQLDDNNVAAHIERARLLFSLGKVQDAVADLHRLCSTATDPLIASYLRAGRILSEAGFGATVAEHGRTVSGSPDPTEALNNLGVFYNSLGVRFTEPALFDLAVDAFRSALAVEPRSYAVLNNLGNAYFEKAMWAEAQATYRQAIEVRPDIAEAHFNLGLVFDNQGAVDPAKREYEKAMRLRPDWDLPRVKLAALEATADAPASQQALAWH